MEPMNIFLTSHRQQFKAFVDQICDISSDRASSAIPPSYATPITILGRLPGTSREGFPSLPYLIDQARECASLVDVWLDGKSDVDEEFEWSAELKRFDQLCDESRDKAKICLTRAEQAERPSGSLEPKWEELVEQMQRKARLREANGHGSPGAGVGDATNDANSSTSSLGHSYFQRTTGPRYGGHKDLSSPGVSHLALATSPQSPLSADEATSEEFDSESSNTPPGSSSGAWDPSHSPTIEALPGALSDSDAGEVGLENSSDVIGSSIYSLTPMKSNRDSAATARPIQVHTPRQPSSGSRKSGSNSVYSLRHSSERGDISSLKKEKQDSASVGGSSTTGGPTGSTSLGPGSSSSSSSYQPVRSLYRLHGAEAGSPNAADSSASLGRKSPISREGRQGIREGVFGNVFRKKTRDREGEGGLSS